MKHDEEAEKRLTQQRLEEPALEDTYDALDG